MSAADSKIRRKFLLARADATITECEQWLRDVAHAERRWPGFAEESGAAQMKSALVVAKLLRTKLLEGGGK